MREDCGVSISRTWASSSSAGAKPSEWLDLLLTNSVAELEEGQAQYSLHAESVGWHHRRSDRLPDRSAGISADCQCRENRRGLYWLRAPISNGADAKLSNSRILAMLTRPWPCKDRGRPRFSRKVFSLPWEERRNRIARVRLTSESARFQSSRRSAWLVRCDHRLYRRSWDLRSSFPRMKRRGSGIPSSPRAPSLAAWERETLFGSKCAIRSMVRTFRRSHTPLEAGLGAFVDFGKRRLHRSRCSPRAKRERHRQKAGRDPCSREIASDSSALPDLCERRKLERRPAGRSRRLLAAESLLAICRSHLPRLGRIWKLRFAAGAIEPVSSRSHFTSQDHECSRGFEVC